MAEYIVANPMRCFALCEEKKASRKSSGIETNSLAFREKHDEHVGKHNFYSFDTYTTLQCLRQDALLISILRLNAFEYRLISNSMSEES